MNIDKSRFFVLLTTIAASTAACSSTGADDTAQNEGAATDGTECIADPRKGEPNVLKAPAWEEGYCFDLASWNQAPQREDRAADIRASFSEGAAMSFTEGVGAAFDDFVYEQCQMYRSIIRPAVAKDVKTCLDALVGTGARTKRVDVLELYKCGTKAFDVCQTEAAIDGRLGNRCKNIVTAINGAAKSTKIDVAGRDFDLTETSCNAVMSGLRPSGRAQLETCVRDQATRTANKIQPKDIFYSCYEGMQSDFSFDKGESPEKFCWNATESGFTIPSSQACDQIASQTKIGIGEFLKSKCEEYRTAFVPAAAEAAVQCLSKSTDVDRDSYKCGNEGLRTVCPDSSVDAPCTQWVAALTRIDPTANAGGRATRECRTLLPGLTTAHRAAVLACAPARAASFGKFTKGNARFALYSCIEGL